MIDAKHFSTIRQRARDKIVTVIGAITVPINRAVLGEEHVFRRGLGNEPKE
jgi:hypothetical protein